jgi:hypothetical protein
MRLINFYRSLSPLGKTLLSIDIFLEVMGFIFILKIIKDAVA